MTSTQNKGREVISKGESIIYVIAMLNRANTDVKIQETFSYFASIFRQYQFIKMLQHLKSEWLKYPSYVAPTELLGESLF